jgi:hypothetical protein
MIITARDILAELQELWPDLWDVWPMDKDFFCPVYADVQEALVKIAKYKVILKEALLENGVMLNTGYRNGAHDCDNFALELQADISRFRMASKTGEVAPVHTQSWAFGTACCTQVRGRRFNHTINICRTSDNGYVFVEPQDNTFWLADKAKDTPYFIEMR